MNMRKNGRLYGTWVVCLWIAGCSTSADSGANGPNTFALKTETSEWKLYAGKNIADRISKGEDLRNSNDTYVEVTIPQALVDETERSPNRVRTFSLETVAPHAIKIFQRIADLDTPNPNAKVGDTAPLKNKEIKPGDAWLSGYVQVFFPDKDIPNLGVYTNVPVLGFTYIKYSKNLWPDGHHSYSATFFQGPGLKMDPDVPTLRYDKLNGTDPANWPALPEHWQ